MQTNLSARTLVIPALIAAALAVMFAVRWKQQSEFSRIKRDYLRLEEQNERLLQDLAQARAASGPPAIDQTQVQPHSPVGPQSQDLNESDGPRPQPPTPNRLALTGTEVNRVPGGLAATLRFSPSQAGPLGVVALVVRLPKNETARILDLAPAGTATYEDNSSRISDDGKFAFFQGTLGDETDVQFTLSVSGSSTADVRGTCGIGAFHLDIQPAGVGVSGK